MFYYSIVDSNTRNPQNIVSYNIEYMDSSVQMFFFSQTRRAAYFYIKKMRKREVGKEPLQKQTRPIHKKRTLQRTHTHKTLYKSALHNRLFDRGQGQVCMRYCYEAVVHSDVWLMSIPSE